MFSTSTLVSLLTLVISVSAAAQKATTGKAAASTAATAAGNTGGDAQTSTTLDPKVIASGFANNGQDVPEAGQVASLTSTNNFINFCLTVPNLPITNGLQITTGSCNPAPMGIIPSSDNMPSSKFINPPNFGTIQAGVTFNIEMAIQGMQTGFFVNAKSNYFSAPQQLNAQGQIQGHSHVVIEKLDSLTQTTPLTSKNYSFFKGLNSAAANGVLTTSVDGGLAAGFYRLASINTAANHQPALVPIAQHGSLDDFVYVSVYFIFDSGRILRGMESNILSLSLKFTVTADGKPSAAAGSADASAASSSAAAATVAASSVAASSSKVTATAAASAVGGATRKVAAPPSKATTTAAVGKGATVAGQKAVSTAASSSKAAVTGKAAGASSTKNSNTGKNAQASSQKAGSQGSKSAASNTAAAKKGQGRTRRAVNRLIQA
ncbi:hypothetical protein CVT25_004089 [Psilocybe cyanescens]|uniref:Uncharacterized protein n=1 Tax=Psilocybe cyanescens TaxID=93625 RepID=A0A409X8Y6_PSICY|nr:hypothetical protein CVT25_004089 [Psilocybe cyanescens]